MDCFVASLLAMTASSISVVLDKRAPRARSGTHMWTAPVPQEFFRRSDRIACIHMSGLLMRSQRIAGQDGFRDASSKQPRDLLRPMGPTDCLAPRIDRSYHLLLSCSSGSTDAAKLPTGRSLKRR